MNDKLAQVVKSIYSRYHAGEIIAEDALEQLELAFAEDNN